jgi:CheY-like chemotaxis protein
MDAKPMILYVEDEVPERIVEDCYKDPFLEELQRAGYKVSIARTGEDAWKSLTEQSFDCVILDIMLPHKGKAPFPANLPGHRTGIFLLDKIRAGVFLPANPANLTVVIASALADPNDHQIIKEHLKPQGYLVKPFFPPTLVQEVKRVIGSAQ